MLDSSTCIYKNFQNLPQEIQQKLLEFEQTYKSLNNLPKRFVKDTVTFIYKALLVQGDSYDYSKFVYLNAHTKGTITCEKHGVFEQTPNNHLNGRGCPECAKELRRELKRSNSKDFIEKSNKIHNNFYDYSKVDYVHARKKVIVTCPIHGDFEITPNDHLSGKGCPKCRYIKSAKSKTFTTEIFIKKAKEVHNNFYDYSIVDYIRNNKKVKIICPIHGVFEQNPNSHLNGSGCPKCANEKTTKRNRELQNIKWSDRFEEGILYLIECWNDVERFIKIGITSRSVEERYNSSKSMPYNYTILKEIYTNSNTVSDTEQYIIDFYESYKPKISFGGDTECLCIDEKYQILEYLENLEKDLEVSEILFIIKCLKITTLKVYDKIY